MWCLKLKKILLKVFTVCFILFAFISLTSCKKSNEYDKITKKCALNAVYQDKDFINDGIGSATLVRPTDGDTASFKLANGTNVTIRFHGIDTPESTGSVELWGKSASEFTKKKLNSATEIVLEATTTPASHDSYGTRYLGYVWYRTDKDAFKNLNLEVVENGYSKNKCLQTSEFKYYNYFKEAEDFAKDKELHIWGNDEDPYFTTEATEVSIKELIENPDLYYNSDNDSGSKVRITAYITDLEISGTSSATYTFKASELIDGKEYSVKVYTGYTSNAATGYLRIGNKYTLTGTMQYHEGGYQISGLTYVPLQTGGDYVTLVQSNYYLTFDSTIAYQKYYGTSLYGHLKVTAAEVVNNQLKLTATAKSSKDAEATEKTFTIIAPAKEGLDAATLVGKSLSTSGYQEKTNEITVLKYEDLRFN